MKIKIFALLLLCSSSFAAKYTSIILDDERPGDFVDVSTVIQQMQVDMRYATAHNFVGRPIKGYDASVCLLTLPAAKALQQVESQLLPKGLTIKVYDCYRPQMAVDDFITWAKQVDQTQMQTEFYPGVNKKDLFKLEYLATHSGHTRGSTLDLTIVPLGSTIPEYNGIQKKCTLPVDERVSDNSLDFGTGFDCFSQLSYSNNPDVSAPARKNRMLLKKLMQQAGFRGYAREWWHFTLNKEPYPKTYFNFPVTTDLTTQK